MCPAVRRPAYTLQIAFAERWKRIPDHPDVVEARYSVRNSTDWHPSCKLELHCSFFCKLGPTLGQLGNYLGALSNWVKLQKSAGNDDVLLFSIVGWHALTLPQDPAALRSARNDMLAVLLSIGLDPERSILFHQDHVSPEIIGHFRATEEFQNSHHMELFWILNCLTPIGKLRRMTTWKVCK